MLEDDISTVGHERHSDDDTVTQNATGSFLDTPDTEDTRNVTHLGIPKRTSVTPEAVSDFDLPSATQIVSPKRFETEDQLAKETTGEVSRSPVLVSRIDSVSDQPATAATTTVGSVSSTRINGEISLRDDSRKVSKIRRRSREKVYRLRGYTTVDKIRRKRQSQSRQRILRRLILALLAILSIYLLFQLYNPVRDWDEWSRILGFQTEQRAATIATTNGTSETR